MTPVATPFRRGELIALVIAILWAGALVAAAFVAPMYQWQSEDSTGTLQQGTATLVDVNGTNIAYVVAIPLALSLVTAAVLWFRGPHRGAGPAAWTLTVLTAAFSVLAILSIGPFILPVVGCLIYACAVHGSGRWNSTGQKGPPARPGGTPPGTFVPQP